VRFVVMIMKQERNMILYNIQKDKE